MDAVLLCAGLGTEGSPIASIFVTINSVSHLPKCVAQFAFLLSFDRDPRQRDRHRGENEQDHCGDDQLKQRETMLEADASTPMECGQLHRSVVFKLSGCAAPTEAPIGWSQKPARRSR